MSLEPHAVSARRISAAIVAHDEDDVLAQTLATARAVADEIVVVDSGTSGKIAALAQAQGAIVVRQSWDHDLAALRNAALERVTGDWVLWLEPGETMTTDAATALRTFAKSEAQLNKIYLLVVTVPPAAGNITGEQVARIRLVPTHCGLRYKGRTARTDRTVA